MRISRRRFLMFSGGALVGGFGLYWGTRERIKLGLIGCGVRGTDLAKTVRYNCYHRLYGEVVAVCDVDRTHAEKVQQAYCPGAEIHEHYSKILERDDIQAVMIATPDHWHAPLAMAAMEAGKAVYCEKPLALTIAEGQQLVAKVRETGAVFQVGTQQRSGQRFQQACELVRNGRLGAIQQVTVTLPEYPSGGPFESSPVPGGLYWDLWLGQAPWAEYCAERCHYRFRSWYEYSGGSMTDWGAHHMDITHWALNFTDAGPLRVAGHAEMPHIDNGYNTPGSFTVDYEYPGGIKVHVQTSKKENGILFEGDRGRIFVNRGKLTGKPVEDLAQNPLPADAIRYRHNEPFWGTGGWTAVHLRDFFSCIKSGLQPISDINSQHRAATACHLANISLRLGRPVSWNAEREGFVNDPEASAFLSRARRDASSLPAAPQPMAERESGTHRG